MPNFGYSKFLPVFLYQKGLDKFRMYIFGTAPFCAYLDDLGDKKHNFLAILQYFLSIFGSERLIIVVE